MLVDRETGQRIATSSWENEAAMFAGEDQLRPIRDPRSRAGTLWAPPDRWTWEIAVMHRTNRNECCRVSWLQGDHGAMTETFRIGILPELERTAAFCSASLMVDRSAGLGFATTAWETRPRWKRAARRPTTCAAGPRATRAARSSTYTSSTSPTHTCTSPRWPEYRLSFGRAHVPRGIGRHLRTCSRPASWSGVETSPSRRAGCCTGSGPSGSAPR